MERAEFSKACSGNVSNWRAQHGRRTRVRTSIYVHQHALGRNRRPGHFEPPLRVMQNRKPQKAYRTYVKGPGPSEILYSLDKRPQRGVRVYIQTDMEVEWADTYCTPSPPSSATVIRIRKINNRKREPDLLPIEVIQAGQSCMTNNVLIHGYFQVIFRHESLHHRILIETDSRVECRGPIAHQRL
jgi:hypothetical protein